MAKRMHGQYNREAASKENIWDKKKQSKFKKWQSFSLDDKIKVIYEVVIGKAKQADVAKKYHQTQVYVSQLVKKVQFNKNLLRELINKHEQK